MKNKLILFTLSIALLSIGACRRDKCCDAGPQPNFLSAFKGASEWTTKMQESNTYQDTLYLFGHVGEEHLSIRIKYKGLGKYVLTGSQVSYMETIGQDVTAVQYYADPAAESFLNVTTYDADKKIIAGNFTLNTLRYYRYDSLASYYPQNLAFTKGSFKISLAK